MRTRWMVALTVVTAVVAVAVVAAGCGGGTKVTEADNGRAITLAAGDTLTVDLEENGTTGYIWMVEAMPEALESIDDTFTPPADTGLVGAAGRRVLTYRAAKAGDGDLKLVYARPWESVQPAKQFTISVTVK